MINGGVPVGVDYDPAQEQKNEKIVRKASWPLDGLCILGVILLMMLKVTTESICRLQSLAKLIFSSMDGRNICTIPDA